MAVARAILAALLLSGCMASAPCDWHREADIVAATWEAHYGPELTDAEYACLHTFEARSVESWRTLCGNSENIGCTRINMVTGHVLVLKHEGLAPERDAWTMRHELVHVLLYCLTGSSDEGHRHPAFAGSSNVAAGGSLARIADTSSSPYECEEP